MHLQQKGGQRKRSAKVSLVTLARRYSDQQQKRAATQGGPRRVAAAQYARFSRGLSKKQALAEARAELGLAEEDPVRFATHERLEARARAITDHWRRVQRSPPLPECWHPQHGGFVREALGEEGDDDPRGEGEDAGDERHVPVACLLDWARREDVVDRAAGRERSLYDGRRKVPTDATAVFEALMDLSDARGLYRVPLLTPHAVARRDDGAPFRAAGGGGGGDGWTVRIGVYANRLLPEVLTLTALHVVMSALDDGSYLVTEPLRLPPARPRGADPVFISARHPVVRVPGAARGGDGDAMEEEEEDNDAMRRDPTVRGATLDQKTISAFTPKGLLKLMENTGNDTTQVSRWALLFRGAWRASPSALLLSYPLFQFPEIARKLAPYLKLDLMLHQQHAVCWMHQMEHLEGFGINSILWEEREFLDGGKYYYSPALGQLRLSRPPATVGGCVTDEMGLGKTLSLLALLAATLDELRGEARDGGDGCTHATLVIVPPALVMQWVNEVRKSCDDKIAVAVLDAGAASIEAGLTGGRGVAARGKGSDVLVTTYSALEKPKTNKWLSSWKWGRVVLDEQQEIRSSTTKIAKNCESLDCCRRWMLSGTPIFEG